MMSSPESATGMGVTNVPLQPNLRTQVSLMQPISSHQYCPPSSPPSNILLSLSSLSTVSSWERDRDVSSVGSTGSLRSELKQAKRDRRQKARDAQEGTEAFTGNDLGGSCEDAGVEEIVVPSQLMPSVQTSRRHTWASPMLSETPVSSNSDSNVSLRDGKRDLMKTWLATPLSGEGLERGDVAVPHVEVPPPTPTLPTSISSLVGLLYPSHHQDTTTSATKYQEHCSNASSTTTSYNCYYSFSPFDNQGYNISSSTVCNNNTTSTTTAHTTIAMSSNGNRSSSSQQQQQHLAQVLDVSSTLPDLDDELQFQKVNDRGGRGNTCRSVTTKEKTHQHDGGDDQYHLHHQVLLDSSMSNQSLGDGGNNNITPPISPPRGKQLVGHKATTIYSPHRSSLVIEPLRPLTLVVFNQIDDVKCGESLAVASSGTGLHSSLPPSGVSPPHDLLSFTLGTAQNSIATGPPLQVSGLRLQPSIKGAVSFNMDVYNLDAWDSEMMMGPFAVDRSGAVVAVDRKRLENESVTTTALHPQSKSCVPHPLPTCHLMPAQSSPGASFQSSLSVLTAYFEEGRLSISTTVNDDVIASPPNAYMPVGALRRPRSPDSRSVSLPPRTLGRSHSTSALSMTTSSYSMLRQIGGNNNNSSNNVIIPPDHKCRAYLQQLGAEHVSSSTPSILVHPHHRTILATSDKYSNTTTTPRTHHQPPAEVQDAALSSFSDIASRYVTVDTLIHKAISYTDQLANPTSGAGHKKFRREHDRWQSAPEPTPISHNIVPSLSVSFS